MKATKWSLMTVMVMIALVMLGNWGSASAGPVPPVPVPTPPPGGGGGASFVSGDGSANSGHGDFHGWGSVSGDGLLVSDMSGSVNIYPDYNPNDEIINRFSAAINLSGSFAKNPNEVPANTRGPSVNGGSTISEYSFVDSDPWNYVTGKTVFSIGYSADTNYWIKGETFFTNIYADFNVSGGRITDSFASFNQNFWSPTSPPAPDWFTLHDWDGYISVSGVVTSVVPEPATLSLLGAGAVAMLVRRRREPKRTPSVIS